MKILFAEVQNWEKETLLKEFPEAGITIEKITEENADQFHDITILSTFIYSTLSANVLQKLTSLKMIATRSTGYDHIDVAYCKENGISICNVPEYGSHTVAEHTFALILSLTRKIDKAIEQLRRLEFNHENLTGIDLFGKTIGIVGLGKIGLNVLHIAKGFGMKIQVFTAHQKEELAKEHGFSYVDLPTLLSTSDVITLHVPYSQKTHHLINCENIVQCKKGCFLINTARGGLIETQAIIEGLHNGILSGVGLDVLEEENEMMEEAEILSQNKSGFDFKTLLLNHVLLNHPNVVITPHNAFNSKEALMNILNTTLQNIKSYNDSAPINCIDLR
ncbi:MAG: hydroxyacid dehydrogenase [Candidatus Levybacteria bacterium]|nr:hydroxyacid dehydrogenase [Candidatus Levybacteria bacterium]